MKTPSNVPKTNVEDIYPLSPMQEGMLFHRLFAPHSGVYVEQQSWSYQGDLNLIALSQAWQEAINRHHILRTAFIYENREKPLQVVSRNVTFKWAQYDWSELSPEEQRSQLADFLKADRERGFHLSAPPLTRLTVIRMREDKYEVIWTHHHLLLDGWSVPLLLNEVGLCYQHFAHGQSFSLEHPRPYRDYITWLKRQDLMKAEHFWRERLQGVAGPTPLGDDRPTLDSSEPASEFGEYRVFLTPEATNRLQQMARQFRLTMNTLVQGAWGFVLSHYSGSDDVVFGATVSGRPVDLAGVESMIGLFINTVPVRVRISSEARVANWLSDLQQDQVTARQYDYTPLAQIHGWTGIPRNHRLFESLFAFENYPIPGSKPGLNGTSKNGKGPEDSVGRASENVELRGVNAFEQAHYSLTIVAGLIPELVFRILYDKSRFDQIRIVRLAEHLQSVLEGIANQPEAQLAELSLLTPAERHHLMMEWRGRCASPRRVGNLASVFARQAATKPDGVAVVCESQQLTYGELERRASAIARRLRSLGTVTETRIGLCLKRSIEMIIGLVGIVKAGGAYVPLDANYPLERLTWMVEDAGLAIVVTEESALERLPSEIAQVICLDSEPLSDEEFEAESREYEVMGDNVVYLSYTSGSTGKPKGVEVCHRGILQLILGAEDVRLDGEQRLLQLSPLAFDASTFEIWGALLRGGCCVLYSGELPTPSELNRVISEERVTTMWLTASLFNTVIDYEWEGLKPLRQLLVGGEALSVSHVRQAAQLLPELKLINGYGPTENTTFTSMWPIDGTKDHSRVAIGRAIGNTRLYVLDGMMDLTPIGLIGQLCIGGDGLARGYLNRPELTAERFIPDPYGEEPGGRLYQSGDLVKYRVDGNLEFIGRADHQVKVRGYRIELGEIEESLRRYPKVEDAVVAAREDEAGNRRLVAYVAAPAADQPTISEVQTYLRQELPEFMVPGIYVMLDTLPLAPNGKVDRQRLPRPELERGSLSEVYEAPQTEIERAIAAVWAEVLGVEKIGVRDNYFELGGDSIRSIQVIAKAKMQGTPFSLQQLFQHPTISELAKVISESADEEISEPVEPFALIDQVDREQMPMGVVDAYPLTRLQTGMIFHSKLSLETPVYHEIFSFHLQAPLEPAAARNTLQDLIERHDILRTSFDLINFTEPLQLVNQWVEVPLEVGDLSSLSKEEQEAELTKIIEQEKRTPFDWQRAPLLRLRLYQRRRETFQFLLSFHHAILDGWSLATFLTEFFRGYLAQLSAAEQGLRSAPQLKFREYVALERRALRDEIGKEFWQQKLSNWIPTRIPRWTSAERVPHLQQFKTKRVFLPEEIRHGLNRLANLQGVPLKSVLLAAHLRVLSGLTGQGDVITGLVSHGRPERLDSERVLGLFLNTVPFRIQMKGGTWAALVQVVFEEERELLPHRFYPMAEIQGSAGREPLFETTFNFIHFHAYQGLQGYNQLQILDSVGVTETNYTFSVDFGVDATGEYLSQSIAYDSNQLHPAQIDLIEEYYLRTLEAMAGDPNGLIESSEIRGDAERQQLLIEWNDTAANYGPERYIDQYLDLWSELTPEAIALVFEDKHLTYDQLRAQVDELAGALCRLGVGPEVFAGVCMERSLEMVIGLVAILRAGGAYVPIDPTHPAERLSFMLRDAEISVLLIQKHLADKLSHHPEKTLCLDDGKVSSEGGPPGMSTEVTDRNSAYLIYTSGSTGKPKGVINTHEAIRNRLLWMQETYRLTSVDRIIQKTPFSFDVSVWEFFWPLMTGACLVLARPDGHQDPAYLAHLIREEQITTAHFVPSMLRFFIEEPEFIQCQSLRQVICSGEVLPSGVEGLFYQRSKAQLNNLYGPTEAAIDVTYWLCRRENRQSTVPIGRPIGNTKIFLLDQQYRTVGIGGVGELHIGGVGLARGYWQRPDLTAERFIPDPLSADVGARMYRTGDLARFHLDGSVDYLGRKDFQVKIRGHRVELGEIETVLRCFAAVLDVAVIATEDEYEDKQLVAYLVIDQDAEIETTAIKEFLRQRLPEQMIPTAFVRLEALPLSAHGKVNRAALPRPGRKDRIRHQELVLPRTPVELQLQKIWEDVLKISPIGVKDNFFELGGNSLLGLRLIGKVLKQTGQDLPLVTIYEDATIEHMASVIDRRSWPQVLKIVDQLPEIKNPIVSIQPKGQRRPFFLVSALGGVLPSNVITSLLDLAPHLNPDQPYYGLQPPGLLQHLGKYLSGNQQLDLSGLQQAFKEQNPGPEIIRTVAAQCIQAIKGVQPHGPYTISGFCSGGIVAFEIARQLHQQGETPELLILIDTAAPIHDQISSGAVASGKSSDAVEPSLTEPQDLEAWMISWFVCKDLGGSKLPQDLENFYQSIRPLSPESRWSYAAEQLKSINALAPDAEGEDVFRLYMIYRVNRIALDHVLGCYQPELYSGAITLLKVDDFDQQHLDQTLGWSRYASQPVRVHLVPGDHGTLFHDPHIKIFARILTEILDGIRKPSEIPQSAGSTFK